VCCVGILYLLISQDMILVYVDCPIMWRFCASEKPCVAVAPLWSPMRSVRIVALGSCNVMLEYIRHGPGCFVLGRVHGRWGDC
jgi:hypothetical protein